MMIHNSGARRARAQPEEHSRITYTDALAFHKVLKPSILPDHSWSSRQLGMYLNEWAPRWAEARRVSAASEEIFEGSTEAFVSAMKGAFFRALIGPPVRDAGAPLPPRSNPPALTREQALKVHAIAGGCALPGAEPRALADFFAAWEPLWAEAHRAGRIPPELFTGTEAQLVAATHRALAAAALFDKDQP